MFQSANKNLEASLVKKAKTAGFDDHHIFPRRFADEFRRAGIEPDKLTVGIKKLAHQKLHSRRGARGGAWNRAWEGFFNSVKDQRDIDPKQVLEFGANMMFGFGLL